MKVEIEVDGLSCPFCAYGLEKKLMELKGVESIDIDLEAGLVILETTIALEENDLRRAVEEAGFTPRAIRFVPASPDTGATSKT